MKLVQDVVFNHTSSFGEQGLFDIIDQEYVLDKGVTGNSVTRKVSNTVLDSFVSQACTENSNKNGIGQIPNYTSYDSIPEGEKYTGAVQYGQENLLYVRMETKHTEIGRHVQVSVGKILRLQQVRLQETVRS